MTQTETAGAGIFSGKGVQGMNRLTICPKCAGTIFIDRDYVDGEWYEFCLQCSYRHYPQPDKVPETVPLTRLRRRKKRRRRKSE